MSVRGPDRSAGAAALLVPIVLAALAVAAPRARADDVAEFLDRHGLSDLLAVHLEAKLAASAGEERDEILVRLAELYADLLERDLAPEHHARIEASSRRLLEAAPGGQAGRLRLALLRATFRGAERVAENHRLRLSTDEEVARARATLAEVGPELNRLRRDLDAQVETIDRRLSRASGGDAIVLGERLERARELASQCTFISAWSSYYVAWLEGDAEPARTAQRLFEELLAFGDEAALPENVSVDLRATEAIARCILGAALCRSVSDSAAAAFAWLDLLEHERSYAPLRDELPAWRIAVLLDHDEFVAVQTVLDGARGEGREVPVTWWRLAAVHALEAQSRSPRAAELGRRAVTELAARGELAQVFDLAQRYGVEALGARGFAVRYVAGVLAYYDARSRHASEEPTDDPAAHARYGDAITALEAAQQERDAADYPAPRVDAERLVAWCRYFRGELLAARRAFETVAERLPSEQAADALWMAIVSLQAHIDRTHDSAAEADFAELSDRFLAAYPASRHAPRLVVRRAARGGPRALETLDELLAIPPHSDVYEDARHRAAQILYELFRASSGDERGSFGHRYLQVALPIFVGGAEKLDASDETATSAHVARGRRVLEVALDERMKRREAAETALTELDDLASHHPGALAAHADELDCRRVQMLLLGGRRPDATALADALAARAPQSLWARLATRAIFKDAVARWRTSRPGSADGIAARGEVVAHGSRVWAEFADDDAALRDDRVLAYAVVLAEALLATWEADRDAETGARALDLYERLLAVRPRHTALLRAAALLGEGLGRTEEALERWRTLLAGSEGESETWYEAKWHVASLLATVDPARARQVLDQHRELHPDYGPPPWGPRLRALDESVRGGAGAPAPAEVPR
jgi:hypothetical protein